MPKKSRRKKFAKYAKKLVIPLATVGVVTSLTVASGVDTNKIISSAANGFNTTMKIIKKIEYFIIELIIVTNRPLFFGDYFDTIFRDFIIVINRPHMYFQVIKR